MRRFKALIMLGGSVVLAMTATFLVYVWLRQQARTQKTPPMQAVVAAAEDLYWGTELSDKVVKIISLPQENLPIGYFSEIKDLVGRGLITNVTTNEPILASKLAPVDAEGGLSSLIPREKRAMSVKVDEVIGVAGFIRPGSRVDVLVTMKPTGKVEGTVAKVILQNVLVLAAGTKGEQRGDLATPTAVNVVTLEVTPEEAEKLALAANEGKIRLALRNPVDAQPIVTKGATTNGLVGYPDIPKKVEVIKGSDVSSQVF